jgi:hypothetical protein
LLAQTLIWPDCFDTLSRYHPFVEKAHRYGLARLHEPIVRSLFTRMWLRARRQHEDLPNTKGKPSLNSVLSEDSTLRRTFLIEVLRINGRKDTDFYRLMEITDADTDFAWLLESISTVPERRVRREMAQLAATLYDFERHAKDFTLLLQRRNEVPELGKAFGWLRAWRLDEEGSVTAKTHYYERLSLQKRLQDGKKPQRDSRKVWQEAYAGLAKRTTDAWAVAAHNFFYGKKEEPDAGASIEHHDLETSSGWKHFGPIEHTEIREPASASRNDRHLGVLRVTRKYHSPTSRR